ncbi:thrombospondin [Micromonospora sp. WMMD987]|uniref:thrombospondin n=1 Tax=Micromonospora sp. WMMD987 TaxID=3016089 RepID=UPI00249A7B5F|nr:thrombospondin [Micromonospora sp. WMMD987]WFE94554.1 thrombospondin [Micromonospora sp. WMMD987]
MVNVPSLLRRRTAQDSNGDGVVDARDGQPVVTDRDGDRTTYRDGSPTTDGGRDADVARRTAERGPTGGGRDAEQRAAERGALARAATARSAVDGTRSAAAARPATVDDEPRTPTDPIRVADTGPVRTAPRPVDAGRPTDRDRTTPVAPAGVTTGPADRDRVTADEARPEPPVVAGPKPRTSLLATLGLIVSVVGATFVLTGTLAGYGIALGALGAVLAVLGLVATRRRHVAGTTDALLGVLVGLTAVVLGVLAFTGQFDWPTTDGDWVARFREWLDSQFVDRF